MLRPLDKADLELILSWRNAPNVRQAMYSQHKITWEEHQLWFQHLQADSSKRWYLYLNKDNEPNGVVYFTQWNAEQGTAFWGFYANPNAAAGTGLRLSLDALDYAFNELRMHKLSAEVLVSNPKSFEMHKKVGFAEEGHFREQHFNGKEYIDVIRLGILASEWPQSRSMLETRIVKLGLFASLSPKYSQSLE